MIIIGLFCLRSVLLPFILASLIAYVFHPLVQHLEKITIKNKKIPRFVSVLIIYFTCALAIIIISLLFIPQFYREMFRLAREATAMLNTLDEGVISIIGQKLENFFRTYEIPIEIAPPTLENINGPVISQRAHWISIDLLNLYRTSIDYIINYITSETKNIVSSAQFIVSKFVAFMFMLLLVFMITGFLLVDSERIKKFFLNMIPQNDRKSFENFLSRLDQRLSGVVRGQLTICLINAILTLIGLLIFNINFAFILATIAGILSLVPIFGSIISTIPIVLVALTSSPITALAALLWVIGIHTLEANFLNPKIMGDSAKIHPILIILSLVAGERFYGMIGALLAVPIMSIIVTIFMSILSRAKHIEGLAKPGRNDRIASKEV
jgi:predicted PurR-regulated permease PerM